MGLRDGNASHLRREALAMGLRDGKATHLSFPPGHPAWHPSAMQEDHHCPLAHQNHNHPPPNTRLQVCHHLLLRLQKRRMVQGLRLDWGLDWRLLRLGCGLELLGRMEVGLGWGALEVKVLEVLEVLAVLVGVLQGGALHPMARLLEDLPQHLHHQISQS